MAFNVVGLALKRPYTFVVMALMLLILGPLAALRTPTDIFPERRIPVIAVAWSYTLNTSKPTRTTGLALSKYFSNLASTLQWPMRR